MCNSSREAWFGLGGQLARKGLHVLALDYRGYGRSGGERSQDPQQQQRNIDEKWPGDVDAAFSFLTSQTGVDGQRIGAAGGSCGVNQAIQLARRHPEVKTLVLLAGGTNREGESFLEASPWLPILAVAADDDGDAVPAMEWLTGFSVHPGNRFLRYADGGHGTALLPIHTDLEPAIADWFVEHLITRPVVATQPTPGARRGRSAETAEALRAPGGAAKARADLEAARATGNRPQLPPEGVVNLMGYERLQAGNAKEAIELFRLNVEAHPESANTYDSLADAYVADGQRELAREMAERAIAVLDADPDPDSEFEGAVRASAEAKRKELAPAAPN
jgi:pimeloyl-ACP methyl ester carboxylesterase